MRREGEGAEGRREAGAGSRTRALPPWGVRRRRPGPRQSQGAGRPDERHGREEPRSRRPEVGGMLTRAHTDFLTEEQRMIRDMAREFAQGELAPHASAWEDAGWIPEETVAKLGELG